MKTDNESKGATPFVLSRRRKVIVASKDMVSTGYLDFSRKFPFVIRALDPEVELIGWTAPHRSFILSELQRCGAILFRGFYMARPQDFRQFVDTISGSPIAYREQTSPRTLVIENVYTSTEYPSDQTIFPHNENSYAVTFPRKLYFWCEVAPQKGGQTPLCDTRRVLSNIHDSVLDKFISKGWMYVRNFSAHFGISWQTAFETNNREDVVEYCRRSAIECEWTANGLRTSQVRPAVARHYESGELIWFNHAAFFHISSVEHELRARLLAQYEPKDLPNNTYYGDGSPIEDRVAKHLLAAYEKEKVSFSWEVGDIVLVDNMLTAHGRAPFFGPRRILVAMAEPYTRPDVSPIGS
jgi:alpha-ketoglutarate-dependent taurine dioxygenase